VIGGDYRLGRVHCEEFIYSFEVVGFEEVDFEKFVYGSEEGWGEDSGYFRLSMVLAFEVFDKTGEDEAQGILVVPDWLGSMMAREIKYCEQLELVARWLGGQEIR
jgi:hypothetical protein